MAEVIWQFVLLMSFALLVVPCLGGALLGGAFAIAKSSIPFGQCWKAYLTACCFAYLAVLALQAISQRDTTALGQVLVFVATTVVTVSVVLRSHSRRVLAVGAVAVCLIDVVLLGLCFVFYHA